MTTRSRNYVFTINNPTPADAGALQRLADSGVAKYICWQPERGESGTDHLQGYVEFRTPSSVSSATRNLGGRAHVETRRGTQAQAIEYCSKPGGTGEFQEFGERGPGQGSRTDLTAVKGLIDAGGTTLQVADEHFGVWCKYYNAFATYAALRTPSRSEKTKGIYLFGESGSGKSYSAYEHAVRSAGAPQHVFSTSFVRGQTAWFDGYDPRQHRAVIIDDFSSCVPFRFLLRLIDQYPMRVPVKGGTRVFTADLVIVTSNLDLSGQYSNVTDIYSRMALERRFEVIVRFSGQYPEVTQDVVKGEFTL